MYSKHPIITGGTMGLVLSVLDMALRPRLASGLAEVFLFFVEGASCYVIYKMMSTDKRAATYTLDGTLISNSTLAGLTIWLTDFVIRPGMLGGPGTEIVKFLLQGIIVYYVLAMANQPASGSGSSDTSTSDPLTGASY